MHPEEKSYDTLKIWKIIKYFKFWKNTENI